ncbi:MAG: WYL domain-containing protein [Betaproteobacteria bacterium]|jgi:hypothetical protein|nr:MAG: WYL domain-containing protein [Betaproteobacteria bacterium]
MPTLPDAQNHRLSLLGHLLRWEGRLNRSRLQQLFGLGPVRASEWIREFREQNPRLLEWDSKARSYLATPEAYRTRRGKDADRQEAAVSLAQYLALAGLPHAAPGIETGHGVWAAFPDLSVPQPQVFAALYEAIRTRRMVKIAYRSMREPKQHDREISPHSLVRAGRRWHVRAFCKTNQDFRDYALGRIADVKALDTAAERGEQDDAAWQARVPVRLVAHPELTPEQAELIRFEYFNGTSARVETCRGALVGYFIQDMRAALKPKKQRPPDYQLAVDNDEEVGRWVFPE